MITSISAPGILHELVSIATPSSASNQPLLEWVRSFLEPHGWQISLMAYNDESGVLKANLIGRPLHSAEVDDIDLAFICHTDTVPFAPEWKEALQLEERNGFLHGCGACDVKGSLACFLAAIANLPVGKVKNVALILTADEEVGCKGMDRMLASTDLRIHSAIISEPTSLRSGIAGKGYGLARITVEGREAHSAFPQQGVSAISVAARLITRIEDEFEALHGPYPNQSVLFDPPRTTLNIGVIEGGTAKNIVPALCTFLIEWRPLPGEDPSFLLTWLERLSAEAQAREPSATVRVTALRTEAGFCSASIGSLKSKLSELLDTNPIGISFGSEAGRVAKIAKEVIVIGPGDMQTAHSNRECVSIAELERWTAVLRELIQRS